MSSIKKIFAFLMLALVVLSAVQVEHSEAAKSDLIFVKGKFIKREKKGTIVVDEKEHCGCHGRRK